MVPRAFGARLALLATLAAVSALTMLGGVGSANAAGGSFPCRWNFELATNLRSGHVVAGANANCAGRTGTLTISVRLQQQDPQTHKWQGLRSATRRFHDLHKQRFVEVDKRCASTAPVTYRSLMSWTLRDGSGRVVAHLTHTAGPVKLGC
jgi:hypothetical protein